MRRILLISYDFPPGLSGVRRIVKFAKFLPEFGFQPIVLAAKPDERMPLDMETLRDVEQQGYPVYRTASADPYHLWNWMRRGRGGAPPATLEKAETQSSALARAVRSAGRFLLVPDDRVGWVPFAKRAADQIMRELAPDFVLTSSYPNSAHLVGVHLKRKFGVKWIADFRDAWTTNVHLPTNQTRFHAQLNARMERDVVRLADAVVTVSDPIAAHLANIAGRDKVHVIANGFDDDDYRDIEPEKFDRFVFAYTGTLFAPRSPEPLFRAMRKLIDAHPELAKQFRLVMMTRLRPQDEQLVPELWLQDIVQNRGLGTYRESVRLQVSADALVAIEAAGANLDYMLTQKVFEYLAARRPILAIAPDGALAHVVRETRSGIVAPPNDVPAIAHALEQMVRREFAYAPDAKAIARYHRRELTRELAGVLERFSVA